MHAASNRFDDMVAGTGMVFGASEQVLVADDLTRVRDVVAEVDAATRSGSWAYGFVSYEAAPALDPSLDAHVRNPADVPLVWFAICDEPHPVPLPSPPTVRRYSLSGWRSARDREQHRADVEAVRERIASGDTYQVNLTTVLSATFEGDATELYADLLAQQRTAYGAYLDLGTNVIASASPELFFVWTDGRLLTRPMKGTAARGRSSLEDVLARTTLLSSAKERAENVIVVDLLRNDVSRVATTGSVRVDRLGTAERYDTVWQLTSDISAHVDADTPLLDVLTALFPSGSVTGAPKSSTMRIIRDLEPQPRGVYCGAIGWIGPPGASTRARFSVAIRTVVIDRARGVATYGVGGGITWSSDPAGEYAELHAKARILDRVDAAADFDLIETMRSTRHGTIRHRDRHLARLAASADYFGFAFDLGAVTRALDDAPTEARVRLTLARDGTVGMTSSPLLPVQPEPVVLAVDDEPVDSSSRWLFHKTTRREVYEQRAARHTTDDVILVNEQGRVTESSIANLAVHLDGNWYTPPVDDGLLPGVERARLVDLGVLHERSMTVADLHDAQAIALVSSLRGWRAAVLAADL